MSVFTLRIYFITLKGLKGLGCHIGLKSETPANTKCKKHMKNKYVYWLKVKTDTVLIKSTESWYVHINIKDILG